MESKLVPLIVIATLLAAGAGLYVLEIGQPSSTGGGTSIPGVTCSSYSTKFTIVASDTGYNDSIAHGVPHNHWPVLCVHQGELIQITILNRDSVEPHGFAVAHYDEAGITVLPGDSATVKIFVNERGNFQIFCNVICAVHPYMLSGLLVVTN